MECKGESLGTASHKAETAEQCKAEYAQCKHDRSDSIAEQQRGHTVRILRVDIDEGPSPLTDPIDLDVEFSTAEVLIDAWWEIKLIVDSVFTRHVIGKYAQT